MASEIRIVNPENLMKIESFFNDPMYKEVIESSCNFNSKLCAERRMRMPFIDPQTGVAQNHCNLYMTKRQRMPGQREGQVYTYPAQRWRKARRQYLMPQVRWGWSTLDTSMVDPVEDSCGLLTDAAGEDSRDGSQTQTQTKEDPKDWFYDEIAMEEIAELEEPEPESDEDYYDDTYANRRKRRGGATAAAGGRGGRKKEETPVKRGGRSGGRGRKRATHGTLPYEVPGDAEKPFGCERKSGRKRNT